MLDALAEIHEANGDLVESKLFKAIRDDDLRAVTFYLSTRMKHRGYTTRVENTGAEGGPIQHEMTPSPDAMLELLEKMAAAQHRCPVPVSSAVLEVTREQAGRTERLPGPLFADSKGRPAAPPSPEVTLVTSARSIPDRGRQDSPHPADGRHP